MARDIVTLELDVKPWKFSRGHRPHRGGAGKHHDRRTKRNRTRAAKKRNAIREWRN